MASPPDACHDAQQEDATMGFLSKRCVSYSENCARIRATSAPASYWILSAIALALVVSIFLT